jgi:hypothetical protein
MPIKEKKELTIIEKIHESINETIKQYEIENYKIGDNEINHDFIKLIKNKDGVYNIYGKIYQQLNGTREEVYNGISYRTSGGLLKDDLLINKVGKFVSKKKCIQETINNRFEKCGVNKSKEKITKDELVK